MPVQAVVILASLAILSLAVLVNWLWTRRWRRGDDPHDHWRYRKP